MNKMFYVIVSIFLISFQGNATEEIFEESIKQSTLKEQLCYGVDRENTIVSLLSKKDDPDSPNLAIVTFSTKDIETNKTILKGYVFGPSKDERMTTSHRYFWYPYDKSRGNLSSFDDYDHSKCTIEKQWKINTFYTRNIFQRINEDQLSQGLMFLEEPYHYRPLKNHFTSAGYAAKILGQYCKINGFNQEPFSLDQTLSSLIKVAKNSSFVGIEKPAEAEVGIFTQILYQTYKKFQKTDEDNSLLEDKKIPKKICSMKDLCL